MPAPQADMRLVQEGSVLYVVFSRQGRGFVAFPFAEAPLPSHLWDHVGG